jgi:hypothetical protein
MGISIPALASAGIKAERGFTSEAYDSRSETFVVGIIATLEAVAVKAGQETPVAVAVPKLMPNANVSNITATLTVVDDGQNGAAQSTTVGITQDKDPPRTVQVSVDAVAGMRNVQIRLDQGTAIWTHPGVVKAGVYGIPDFSTQANAYLDKYHSQDGKVTLQFMVKSDTDGHAFITIDDVASSLLQTQSWKNQLDSTFRVDRTLNLTFSQVERLAIDAVTPAPGHNAVVSQIRLDVGGQFSADRLLGAVETHDQRQFATVSQDFSIAQQATPVKSLLKVAIQCTGVAGYFEADDKAEFYVELQADQNGSPAADAPLAKSNVAFTPADKKDPQPWTFAKFEKAAELKPDIPYWILVKGVRNPVRLGIKAADVEPATEGQAETVPVIRGKLLMNRGGQIWKGLAVSPLHGLLSLVYAPQSDNQTAAIEISIGDGGTTQRLDLQSTTKTITFPTSGSGAPLLVVHSKALGSLTIANVIQEYNLP